LARRPVRRRVLFCDLAGLRVAEQFVVLDNKEAAIVEAKRRLDAPISK
jgi:hypothetical protein